MKNKFKDYSFWMSVTAAVILVLNNFGKAFGFSVNNELITQTVDSVCGVLILFGIITMSKKDGTKEDEKENVSNVDFLSVFEKKDVANKSKNDEKLDSQNVDDKGKENATRQNACDQEKQDFKE